MSEQPRASRPAMPGYGLEEAGAGRGLLPWNWARERLAASRNYWLSTCRVGGAPHAAPVWGLWLDDRFVFSTGALSRKARNLAADPRCVVTTERAEEAVIVEGVAGVGELSDAVVEAYRAKYGWDLQPPVYVVRPRVAFGFIEREEEFTETATRWTFAAGEPGDGGG